MPSLENLTERVVRIEEKTDRQTTLLEDISYALNGNGSPGIKTRLDRLEMSGKLQSRIIWLIAGAVASSGMWVIGEWIWSALSHSK